MISRRLLLSICVLAVLAGAGMATFLVPLDGRLPLPVSSGIARVGGPFTLTDHTGKRISDADFRGRWMLIYFGYTYCPDVCPSELQVISSALDKLGSIADQIQPLFITVDPARDTTDVLAQYVESFHPRLIGLTGSEEEIRDVTKAYRVYYKRADNGSDPDNYMVDHASIVYLMNPDGKFVRHFAYGTDADKFADALKQTLAGSR